MRAAELSRLLCRLARAYFVGQEASMFLSALSRSSDPLAQAVISFQNEPAPTSPGMRSEPSKRTLVALARILATPRSISLPYQAASASLWGAMVPPEASQVFRWSPRVNHSITA